MSISIEQELNELRSLIAQSASVSPKTAKALEARLAALEARVESERKIDPDERARQRILQELSTANNGKPGYLSMAEIGDRCKMSKSSVHSHVNTLEKAGKVWIRKTHYRDHPEFGNRPTFFVYHPSAVRA